MTTIKLTFLGTGAAIPTLKRGHTTLHIQYLGGSGRSILFDCGEGTQTNLIRAGINFMGIDAIFITHWHADHFIGLYGLLNSMGLEGRQKPVRIFGPHADKIGPKLLEFYKFPYAIEYYDTYRDGLVYNGEEFTIEAAKLKHTIDNVGYRLIEKGRLKLDKKLIKQIGLSGLECKELKENGKVTKNGKKISLKDVSYKVPGKIFVYSGDTVYQKKMEKFAKDADILVHECTCFTKDDLQDKMHSSFEDILKLKGFAKKVYLVHIGRKYQSHEELQKEAAIYKNIFFAKDLEKIEI
ncbi:MAG: MBL fold metallo-hydrolase [Candidatus Aenigmarchaeota archaeon]|nr:MBL fold metallo-hydrolase [Candidatus Aenigmarchaeota archaeon]